MNKTILTTKLLGISALLMLLGTINTASAATYTDSYSTTTDMEARLIKANSDVHSWQFNIDLSNFDPATQVITGATVTLLFNDYTNESINSSEAAKAKINNIVMPAWKIANGSKILDVTSLTTLAATGAMNISITATEGDFIFLGGTLTVNTTNKVPSAVPAPSALLLMGSGLIGIASTIRRKKNKA